MSAEVDAHIDQWVVDPQLREWLTCAICCDILYEPVNLSTCPHTFCRHCLHAHVHSQHAKCPLCNVRLSRNIHELLNVDDCISGARNEQLRKARVACPECEEWTGTLGANRQHVIAHRAACGAFVLECEKKCGQSLPRRAMAQHEEEECRRRTVQCPRCSTSMTAAELSKHHVGERLCKNTAFCQSGCGEVVLQSERQEHNDSCPDYSSAARPAVAGTCAAPTCWRTCAPSAPSGWCAANGATSGRC